MVDKDFRIHPSDEELAGFIDNRLRLDRKELIKKHILECERCRSCVVDGLKEKEKVGYVNSTKCFTYLAPILAASVAIVFVPMFEQESFSKGLEVVNVSLFDMFVEWVKSLF